jgi:hypothetical protein
MTDYTDLQTRGFVVVRSFLSESEVFECREDFARQRTASSNRNYGISFASQAMNHKLLPAVRESLRSVLEQTDIRADLPSGAAYFAVTHGVNFWWHQDHESFFTCQNHYDYLNFYIPIVKPRVDKSNLSIVPFDILKRDSPRTYEKLVRNGATRFIRVGRRGVVFCDDSGTVLVLPRDIGEMAHTPQLAPGDLLLMRGDMIHRTQDTETERVALSFRVSSRNALVHRSKLADGGMEKARMMAKNPQQYERMFRAFDAVQKDVASYEELNQVMSTMEAPPAKARREFMRYLLGQKRRSGVLTRFLPKVLVGAAMSNYVNLYRRMGIGRLTGARA